MITALIMAGGEGTRFWPLSRSHRPKQFLKLSDNQKTMLQKTVERITSLLPIEQVFIATNQAYQETIQKQLAELPAENIIVEPMKRDTAACIGLSAIVINKKHPGSTMIVLPADHLIKNEERFLNILNKAIMIAASGRNLVTLGIKPTHPETGYGYINYGDLCHSIDGDEVYQVKSFTEKPDLETAKGFLEDGKYLWNSGMFVWQVNSILDNIKLHMHDLYQSLERMKKALGTDLEEKIIRDEFSNLEALSIDCGIMEKADNIFVILSSFGWDDLGSWPALERVKKVDGDGNVVFGKHYGIDTIGSIIHSHDKVITTIGLKDIVIVDTEDAILICDKRRAQEIKEIRKILEDNGLEDCL